MCLRECTLSLSPSLGHLYRHAVIYSILQQIDYLILMKRWMLHRAKLKVNIGYTNNVQVNRLSFSLILSPSIFSTSSIWNGNSTMRMAKLLNTIWYTFDVGFFINKISIQITFQYKVVFANSHRLNQSKMFLHHQNGVLFRLSDLIASKSVDVDVQWDFLNPDTIQHSFYAKRYK